LQRVFYLTILKWKWYNLVKGRGMEKKRSVGMTVVGLYLILMGILSITTVIVPIFFIPVGIYILKLKDRARKYGIITHLILLILSIITIIGYCWKLFSTSSEHIKQMQYVAALVLGNALMLAIICGIVIFFLTRPKVKEQFK